MLPGPSLLFGGKTLRLLAPCESVIKPGALGPRAPVQRFPAYKISICRSARGKDTEAGKAFSGTRSVQKATQKLNPKLRIWRSFESGEAESIRQGATRIQDPDSYSWGLKRPLQVLACISGM